MRTSLENLLGAWVDRCEHRPVLVMALIVALTLVSAFVVWRHAAVDSDLGKLIRPSDSVAWYRHNEAYKHAFPQLQQTAVVVVSGVDPAAVDGVAVALTEAFRRSGRFDFVFAPTVDPFLRNHRAYFLGEADLEAWVEGVQYDFGALLRLADSADLASAAFTFADHAQANDGLRLPSVLASVAGAFTAPESIEAQLDAGLEAYPHLQPWSADSYYALIMLKGPQRLDERLPNAALVEQIRTLVSETPRPASVDVRLTGEVPLSDEEIATAMQGIGIAGTLSLVLLAVILGFGVRSVRVVGSLFALLGVGVLWTLAFATLAVGSFNTLSLIFVVMFFGLGVDFAVHFALQMRESRRALLPDGDAEVDAARVVGPALLLCMLTSCIAFLSFTPTDYRGLGELGVICAGGMVIAFVLTLSMIPACFSLLRIPVEPRNDGLRWLHQLPLPSAKILVATALLALPAGFAAARLHFDYSVLAMRDDATEAMGTLLELQQRGITTDYSIAVLARDASAAAGLKVALEGLPEVGEVDTPEDLVPPRQAEKQAILQTLGLLVDSIDPVVAGQADGALADAIDYLGDARGSVAVSDRAVYEAFLGGLRKLRDDPAALARADRALEQGLRRELADLRVLVHAEPFTLSELPADLLARLVDQSGRQLVVVQPAGPVASRAATEAFINAVAAVAPNYAGRAVVEWGVGEVAVRSFKEAVSLAVVCIGLVLVAFFRGVLLPLIVLLPLALTTLFTFALMVVLGIDLNMANILVVPLIFGLGVDTGIHVVHRFQTGGGVAAVFASSTGKAVLISALTTIGTFFSLSFSTHKGAASVGLLLTIAISVMLLATFVVLPAMLDLLQRRAAATATSQPRQ